jgi:heme/copper-type cytochrome/quinol oxidase subunit 2
MNMSKLACKAAILSALFYAGAAQASVDSYRYLHVTIETPWVIFLVLVPLVLAPLVLMGIMVWRYAERRKEDEEGGKAVEGGQE